MKRFWFLLFAIIILFSFSSCYDENTYEYEENSIETDCEDEVEKEFYYLRCDECEKSIEDCDYVKNHYDNYLCIPCAFYEGYVKCKGCDSYFISDIALDTTAYYCSSCAYDYASGCHLCGSGPLDFDKLVKFVVDNESCYMCVDCCADYFSNIEQMKPCYFCIECGNIFGGKYYLHYVYDETICANCVNEKGFKKCRLCKKYYDEGKNGVCGYCIEKGEE